LTILDFGFWINARRVEAIQDELPLQSKIGNPKSLKFSRSGIRPFRDFDDNPPQQQLHAQYDEAEEDGDERSLSPSLIGRAV
jgi:hypothetical protein